MAIHRGGNLPTYLLEITKSVRVGGLLDDTENSAIRPGSVRHMKRLSIRMALREAAYCTRAGASI